MERYVLGDQPAKRCTKCKEIKQLTDFNRLSSSTDGRKPACRECAKLAAKEYNRDQDKNYANIAKWRKKLQTSTKEEISHGRVTSYIIAGCRCEACKTAYAYSLELKLQKLRIKK